MREVSEPSRRQLSRRGLLKAVLGLPLKLAGGAVVAFAGVAAITRTSGYSLGTERRLVSVSPWQFVVLQHAARRIAAPDRAEDESIPSADSLDVAGFVDEWMARMPAQARRDLGRFLAVVEHVAPLRLGFVSRFTRLTPVRQDKVLASLEGSSSDLLRAGFDGVKSLVLLGYYSHARTWRLIGYDGPRIDRPTAGWDDATTGGPR